mgnify:CR=1 FL=1
MSGAVDHDRRRILTGLAVGSAFAILSPFARSAGVDYPFTLGVASGDPLPDGFVIWTRLAPLFNAADGRGGLSRSVPVRWLILLMVALGTIVGVVDVVSVAFAQQQGQPAAASIVLSVYAIGSCLAGLAFGALKLVVPLPRLFLYGGVATALTTLPLLLASDILSLALTVFVAGLFFAPTLIVAMALIERIVPPAKLTEGLTWLVTGLSIGVAVGAAGSGWLVDAYGARSGFWLALVGGLVVLLAAWQSYRCLK